MNVVLKLGLLLLTGPDSDPRYRARYSFARHWIASPWSLGGCGQTSGNFSLPAITEANVSCRLLACRCEVQLQCPRHRPGMAPDAGFAFSFL